MLYIVRTATAHTFRILFPLTDRWRTWGWWIRCKKKIVLCSLAWAIFLQIETVPNRIIIEFNFRHPQCGSLKYSGKLPAASVIFPFHEEVVHPLNLMSSFMLCVCCFFQFSFLLRIDVLAQLDAVAFRLFDHQSITEGVACGDYFGWRFQVSDVVCREMTYWMFSCYFENAIIISVYILVKSHFWRNRSKIFWRTRRLTIS